MVKDLLFTDNNRQTLEETKEKLKFLNTADTKYSCDGNGNRLNHISELDSTGRLRSILFKSVYNKSLFSISVKQSTPLKIPYSAVLCIV